MSAPFRIGVDVGGTNTDAVVMAGRSILAAVKRPTTRDVTDGVAAALQAVMAQAGVAASAIGLVVVGTTHFTNAVVERRHLTPTAVVRLCGPATRSLPPMVDWPADLARVVGAEAYYAKGGVEFDGRPIAPLDPDEIRRIGAEIRRRGRTAIAVCSVFAGVDDAMERAAAALLAEACPGAAITQSAALGRLGLLERESATILNSALAALARRTVAGFRQALADCRLACPLLISQNDGTVMSADAVQRHPILTFASGPTNSMRGAAFLSGHRDAIIVDIGGTTTDVGLLQHGFPRQAAMTVKIGGVRTNFRMPDLLTVGLGGGSLVGGSLVGGATRVGPQSVGYEIASRALLFGGSELTASDIAVAAGRAAIGDPGRVGGLEPGLVRGALATIDRMIEDAVDRSRVSAEKLPVIMVGGGSILAPRHIAGSEIVRPEHFAVANAVGAAIAQVGGEVDRIYALDGMTRQQALEAAEREARERAVAAGALPDSLAVTDREDVPLAYLPGNATRIRVKVAGDMALPGHA